MLALHEHDGLTQRELCERVRIQQPTMDTLQRMERDALIRREPDPADGRRTRVVLTAQARDLEDHLVAAARDVNGIATKKPQRPRGLRLHAHRRPDHPQPRSRQPNFYGAAVNTTTIATDQDVAALINVLTVTRENQQPLVDLLSKATDTVMRHRPGFVSANIHQPRRHPGGQLRSVAQPGRLPDDAR